MDGGALTNVRTPAVSALGALRLASPGPKSLLVFGTGRQAWQHIKAFNDVFRLTQVGIVGRNAASATLLAARAFAMGLSAAVARDHQVADADLVVCCTGSSLPLFDGSMVKEDAVVIAIGSHEPDKRELDDALLSRSSIYVESLDSCQREAVLALASGAVAGPEQLNTLADLVQGLKPRPSGRPAVFKTTGMPWQDLAVAAAAYEAYLCESSDPHDAWRPRSRWTSDWVGHAEE